MSVKHEPLPRGPWRWVQNSGEWSLVTDHSGQKVVLGTVEAGEDLDGQPFMDVLAVRDETGMLVPLTPESPLGRALVALPGIIEAAKDLNFAACTGRFAIDEVFEKVTTRMEEALSSLQGNPTMCSACYEEARLEAAD